MSLADSITTCRLLSAPHAARRNKTTAIAIENHALILLYSPFFLLLTSLGAVELAGPMFGKARPFLAQSITTRVSYPSSTLAVKNSAFRSRKSNEMTGGVFSTAETFAFYCKDKLIFC
jgi:hypothetical protein